MHRRARARLIAPIAVAGILASGCGATATVAPTTVASDTALPSASATATTLTPTATPTSTPSSTGSGAAGSGDVSASPTATVDPVDRTAPPKLPKGSAGVVLKAGECFDMDDWVIGPGPNCDLQIDDKLVMHPVSGAIIASKSQRSAPSLFDCRSADLETAPVAPDLNSYLCLRTSQGTYGFVVQREDRPTAPSGRIVIDYWLYK
jgi:hypothetical protein